MTKEKRMRGSWWWIDRWRRSTAYTDMTLAEQGAYRNLLDELWLRGGPIPDNERTLAKASGDALEWPAVKEAVMAHFKLGKKGWSNETHTEIAAFALSQSAKGKARSKGAQRGSGGQFLPAQPAGGSSGGSQGARPAGDQPPISVSDLRSPELEREQISVSTKPHSAKAENGVVKRLFDQWVFIMGKNPKQAKLTPKRKRLMEARLAEGYTEQMLLEAIQGCKDSPHHQGDNDRNQVYDSLDLICRDGEHVEMFLCEKAAPTPSKLRPGTSSYAADLVEKACQSEFGGLER